MPGLPGNLSDSLAGVALVELLKPALYGGLALAGRSVQQKWKYRQFRGFWKDFANGPVAIVLSDTGQAFGNRYTGLEDAFGASEVLHVLRGLNKDLKPLVLSAGQVTPPLVEDRHIITVGGPGSNSVTSRFVHERNHLVEVLVDGGIGVGYRWLPDNTDYRPRTSPDHRTAFEDVGFVVSGPSPYSSNHRMVSLFGLRGVGSWGAARAICTDERVSKTIWKQFKKSSHAFRAWAVWMNVEEISFPNHIRIGSYHGCNAE